MIEEVSSILLSRLIVGGSNEDCMHGNGVGHVDFGIIVGSGMGEKTVKGLLFSLVCGPKFIYAQKNFK